MKHVAQMVGALHRRITACRELPFQVLGEPHERAVDPIRGTTVLVNPRRADRPPGDDEHCPYCEGRTPPTLCYVPAGEAGRPLPRVEDEDSSLTFIRRLVGASAGAEVSPFAAIEALGAQRRDIAPGVWVPLVHPSDPWLARVFLNLVPAMHDAAGREACFVISVPPAHHGDDLGILGPWTEAGRVGSRALPPSIVEAVVACWCLLEAWADSQGLASIPFVNGGKDRRSGQSVSCFHSQVYATAADDRPPLFQVIARRRATAGCPVCAVLDRPELRLRDFGSIAVMTHPAPERDLTWLVAPIQETASLGALPSPADLAAALSWAVRLYEPMLGGVPAYVLAVRTGQLVGHLHVEIVPRSQVNVPGGFETATGFAVAARRPSATVAAVRALMADGRVTGP